MSCMFCLYDSGKPFENTDRDLCEKHAAHTWPCPVCALPRAAAPSFPDSPRNYPMCPECAAKWRAGG